MEWKLNYILYLKSEVYKCLKGDYVNRIVECPYCSYEYKFGEVWTKDEIGLNHECVNCENEYLITETEVSKWERGDWDD